MSVLTKEIKDKIPEWKERFGKVYQLDAKDGNTAIIYDPVSSLPIMKKAFMALAKHKTLYAHSIINDCWLAGNEVMKTDERYANELADHIDDITDIPDYEIEEKGERLVLKCLGESIELRKVKRQDLIDGDNVNPESIPFDSQAYILKTVAFDEKALQDIEFQNTKAYIGMLTAVKDLEDKVKVVVKEL